MTPKILPLDLYIKNFNVFTPKSAFGITTEEGTFEHYFFVQTIMPKSFIFSDYRDFFSYDITALPDDILIRFELFGKGRLNSGEAFIFKPWAAGIDNSLVYEIIENFHLFMPATLFYNLIANLIFLERINIRQFSHTRVLEDIEKESFSLFGLHRASIAQYFQVPKFSVERVSTDTQDVIYNFCLANDYDITALRHKYFLHKTNAWFAIMNFDETIGYIRLYTQDNASTGGVHIEYIIAKSFRNKGYASTAVIAVTQYLKEYSYAFSVYAEVDKGNAYSIKLLESVGFKKANTPNAIFAKTDFSLSLLGAVNELEEGFKDGFVETSIEQVYVDEFWRYF